MQLCRVEWFAERDIDILLAEELRFNEGFARWMAQQCGAEPGLLFPARETRVSVVRDRETDVQALFAREGGGTWALLIEDKIGADFQPDQMPDYVKRGEQGVRDGLWDTFAVAVFAPRCRFPIPELPAGVAMVSFQDAAEALLIAAPGESRARYRSEFLRLAGEPRVGVAKEVSEASVAWWVTVNAMVRERYGDFLSTPNPSNDSWVNPKWPGQPHYLRLDIKGRTGQVALAVKGAGEDAVRQMVSSGSHEGLEVIKKAGWVDPAIVVTKEFAKYNVNDNIVAARDGILDAYGGAYLLHQYWLANREKFENLGTG